MTGEFVIGWQSRNPEAQQFLISFSNLVVSTIHHKAHMLIGNTQAQETQPIHTSYSHIYTGLRNKTRAAFFFLAYYESSSVSLHLL